MQSKFPTASREGAGSEDRPTACVLYVYKQLGSSLSTAGGSELIVEGSLREDRAIFSCLGNRLYA